MELNLKGLKLDLDFFENVVIWKSLTDDQFLSTIIDYCQSDFFQNKSNKLAYNLISEFYRKKNTAPTFNELKQYISTDELRQAFTKVLGVIKDLQSSPIGDDELYANAERFLKERAVYNNLIQISTDIGDGIIDTAKILDSFEKSCNISLVQDLGLEIHRDVDKIVDHLTTQEVKLKTKWGWLDQKLSGGLPEDGKCMLVFAGETNIGKSIVLGNIAENIASQGKTVLLISLEMSEMMYAKRICSSSTGITIKELPNNTTSLRTILNDQRKTNPHQRLIIKEFPPSTLTISQLQGFIKRLVSKGIKPDCIVVDYLTLLHSPQGHNSYEKGKYNAEQLRALSYIFKAPVVTAVQMRRDAFNTENPDMTSISESIAIAQTADFMASVFRGEDDKELGLIKMGVMKNRFEVNSGVFTMRIDHNTLHLSETEFNDETNDSLSSSTTDLLEKFTASHN